MKLRYVARKAAYVFVAALAGAMASVWVAGPASAMVEPLLLVNDGEISCMVSGELLVPWHLTNNNDFEITLTGFEETPPDPLTEDTISGTVMPAFEVLGITQIVAKGTTAAGLTFHWEKVGDPSVKGSVSGMAIQEFPSCAAVVTAEFTSNCGKVGTVKLINSSDESQTFVIEDANHEVAAGASKTVENVKINSDGKVVVFVDHPFLDIDLLVESFTWNQPRVCPSPTSPPVLSQTGTPLGGILGVGVGLVVLGAGLLAAIGILRRRRGSAAAS